MDIWRIPDIFTQNASTKQWKKVRIVYYEGLFYVRREVDLMTTAKLNAYIVHIFGKIELLSIYAT